MNAPAVRVLWRPGLGLAVWPWQPDVEPAEPGSLLDDAAALPSSLTDLLGGRRLRHTVELRTPGGSRAFVPTTAVGVPTAVQLLDRFDHLPVGGDAAFYRYVIAGVRSFVDAGAVAPGVVEVAGTAEVRWLPLPTGAWRAWLHVAHGSAPPAVAANGGGAAVTDFATEVLDYEVRRGLADRVSSHVDLIAGLAEPAPMPVTTAAGARGAWNDWLSTVGPEASSLVLRLHEPPDDPDPDVRWRLEVCRHDATGDVVPVVPHRLDPHDLETITGDLAQAVRAFGELSRADTDPHSLDFLLDTATVDELLQVGATAIADAGVTVLLPRTIAVVSPSLSLTAPPVPDGGSRPGFVGLDEISDFEWRLALGDAPDSPALTQADLDELAQQHGNLVRVRGRWLRAEGAALTRAAAFLAAQKAVATSDDDTKMTMAELLSLVADPHDRLPVPVTSVDGLGWLDDVARSGSIVPEPVTPPAALNATLRPYQQRGLDWLVSLGRIGAGAVLADDMGLGKTVQVIALLMTMRDDAPARPPALVVCPMSVIGNWQRELTTFAPSLTVIVHHGTGRSVDAISDDAPDVVLTTFATLARDKAAMSALAWSELVVDEAQHVKNVNTAAAKALRAIPARLRVALTGTPVENRLEDLRAVIDLVNPGMLGSASVFRARFAEPIERDRDQDALRRLNALTGPFILRRTKADPAVAPDLPEKTELTVRTNLTSEQAGLYQAVLNDLHEALADPNQRGEFRRRSVLAALTRLKQICNHPAHYLADGSPLLRRRRHRSGKVELLIDILTTLIAEGDRALVFTQFAAFADLLDEWLSPILGVSVPVLHGGRTRRDRDAMVADFQSADGPPVLIATLKAGGTGLNLVGANHVIHADRWWNPAVEDQATDRAYRIGQTRNVQVRKFVCVGTLEERIDEMVTAKRELSQLTVSTGENWLSDLDDAALFDLLALRDEAVGE